MKLDFVVCGLGMSSAWGSGHATLWRALCRALAELGHRVVFFERDQPFYARYRDFERVDYCELVLYKEWSEIAARLGRELDAADVGMVTSFCPDAAPATEAVLGSHAAHKVFYDLDTPVTLACIDEKGSCPYIGPGGLAGFDWVLSFTGGRALDALQERLGARVALPLYGSVDPQTHSPAPGAVRQRAALSYLGTYAADRAPSMEELFFAPARRLRDQSFLVGGAQYPDGFNWEGNVQFMGHVPPSEHAEFYRGSRFTLNLTRSAMRDYGFCPSGRLFEAAACGTAMLSDEWEGIETFFEPERELLLVRSSDDVLRALSLPDAEVERLGAAARARALAAHTAAARARELVRYVSDIPRTGNVSPADFASWGSLSSRQGVM
jgi:spore maturation protein CgeB